MFEDRNCVNYFLSKKRHADLSFLIESTLEGMFKNLRNSLPTSTEDATIFFSNIVGIVKLVSHSEFNGFYTGIGKMVVLVLEYLEC